MRDKKEKTKTRETKKRCWGKPSALRFRSCGRVALKAKTPSWANSSLHQGAPPRAAKRGDRIESVFSPTAESFGVSAQGSGVVRGGPEVRFHEGSTRSGWCEHKKSTACCWGYHLSYLFSRPTERMLCATPKTKGTKGG